MRAYKWCWDAKYCVVTRNIERTNIWFQHCARTNRPYVIIKPMIKYSWVEIDLIGQRYNLHPIGAREIDSLLMAHWNKKGVFYDWDGWYPAVLLFGKVAKDSAESIAERMFDLASNPDLQVDLETCHRWPPDERAVEVGGS
jgi:hypothetical protein